MTQSLLQDFLQGRNQSQASPTIFYQLQGWRPEMHIVLIILKQKNNVPDIYRYYLSALQNYFPDGLFFIHSLSDEAQDQEIICCMPEELLREAGGGKRFGLQVSETMQKIADMLHLDCHCSYAFPGIENIRLQYAQARTCLSLDKRHYYECGLKDLASLDRSTDYRRLALHPVLNRILEYDRQKNTSFYHILKIYLRCERNRVLTAQKLFMHKNTLVYRLERITTLFGLNLDDPYEREYLLLSFRCLEPTRNFE
ncbi:MAG: PucR family transcriptional regulator [Ruminococcus sp.]